MERRSAALLLLVTLVAAGCTSLPGTGGVSDQAEPGISPLNVEGYAIFQDYIDVIEATPTSGSPFGFDGVKVKARVTSINEQQICPYDQPVSECPIEPYPKVTGTIQVQEIYHYDREGDEYQTAAEEPLGDEGEEVNDTNTQPGERGNYTRPDSPRWSPLEEGEETTTLFVLTADSVIVRNAANPNVGAGRQIEPGAESGQESTSDPGGVASKNLTGEPSQEGYKSIPTEDGKYVFTTKVQGDTDTRYTLPGLQEGDTFNATIGYAGWAYVREYQVLE